MRYLGIAAFAAFFVAGTAHAAVLVDRGLPTANLNSAAGSDRSNISWGYLPSVGDYSTGDTFTLGGSSPVRIDSLTAWFTTASPDPQDNFELDSRFSDVSLYLGPSGPLGTSINKVAGSAIAGNSATDTDVTVSKVTYAGGEDYYQGSSGSYIQLWEVTFFNLGVHSPGEYLFSVYGSSVADDAWFNHGSHAALGGVPADGADDTYAAVAGGPGMQLGAFFTDEGWDKASDINVVAQGAVIPLPASGLLLLAGAGCLGVLRRRRTAG